MYPASSLLSLLLSCLIILPGKYLPPVYSVFLFLPFHSIVFCQINSEIHFSVLMADELPPLIESKASPYPAAPSLPEHMRFPCLQFLCLQLILPFVCNYQRLLLCQITSNLHLERILHPLHPALERVHYILYNHKKSILPIRRKMAAFLLCVVHDFLLSLYVSNFLDDLIVW